MGAGTFRLMKNFSLTAFLDLGLAEPITRALVDQQYTLPTPIQAQTIPQVLAARDVVGIAQTGTGKTAAFALPILHHLSAARRAPEPRSCRVLVLSPTRELSSQIVESFETYGRYLEPRVALVIGGVPTQPQVRALARGVDVLVATPGRLRDLMQMGAVRLDRVEIFVLDEADRMLDMGFIHDIRAIVGRLPQRRQNLFFSATMPQAITELAGQLLRNPVRVAVIPGATTVERVEQRVIHIDRAGKPALLAEILRQEPIERVLVFTRTKRGADKVVRALDKAGLAAESDPRQQVPEPARARAGELPNRTRAHADRHRHRRARDRRRGHQPCRQLRSPEHSGKLRASHRPHRTRRRRRDSDFLLRCRRAILPAGHREADPDVYTIDRPAQRTAQRARAARGCHREWKGGAPQ